MDKYTLNDQYTRIDRYTHIDLYTHIDRYTHIDQYTLIDTASYTNLRAHETKGNHVCLLQHEKKKQNKAVHSCQSDEYI